MCMKLWQETVLIYATRTIHCQLNKVCMLREYRKYLTKKKDRMGGYSIFIILDKATWLGRACLGKGEPRQLRLVQLRKMISHEMHALDSSEQYNGQGDITF